MPRSGWPFRATGRARWQRLMRPTGCEFTRIRKPFTAPSPKIGPGIPPRSEKAASRSPPAAPTHWRFRPRFRRRGMRRAIWARPWTFACRKATKRSESKLAIECASAAANPASPPAPPEIVTAATEKRLAVDFDGETVLLDPRSPPPLELGYAIGLHAARHRVADRVDVAVAPGWNTRSLYTALSRHRQQVTLYAQAERTPDARSIGVIASRQAERPFSQDRLTRWEALDSSAPGQTAEVLRGAWRRLQEDDLAQLEERDRVAREAAGGVQHALEDRVEAWISANDNRQGAIRRLAAGMREARSVAKMSVPATIHAGKTEENQARWRALRRESRTTGIPLRDLAGYAEVAARMQRLGEAAGELLEAGTDAAAAIRAHGGRTLGRSCEAARGSLA